VFQRVGLPTVLTRAQDANTVGGQMPCGWYIVRSNPAGQIAYAGLTGRFLTDRPGN